ncbi:MULTISPECIES: n-acetylglutamate synthase [Sphingobacterium]|uniref:n-acetylglutamate synthase n=1 Tax=Sphingobacterium TaxID=28453 RepID=UPI001917BDCC|nr:MULTISPECIES: n-acetylglutamate synthase [Sphingobacterium]QQT32878.1 n-acetylglutamate synthase [Sphingobacterium multivorum]
MNYNNRIFRVINNSDNGDTSGETTFHYIQVGNILNSNYSGGNIVSGHLLGVVDENGNIDMRYHHINTAGEIMTGLCKSTPEILKDGRIRLHEEWKWTSGDQSSGKSIIEEIV